MKVLCKCIVLSMLAVNILTFNNLMADEVYMNNGDRITGEIVNMNGGKLVIKTPYADEIGIKWAEIANLKTDKEITLLLSDETLIRGNPQGIEQGKIKFNTSKISEPVSVSIADIISLNPPDEPPVKIKTMANIGMTFTSGNTEKDTTHFDGEFSARTEKNRYTAGGQLNKSEDNGVKTESNSLGYLKYDHFLSKRWFAYANSLFEKDKFKDLSLRSALGVGIGHQFFETPVTNLSLESGLNYVSDDYIVAPDESYSSGRWAINYDKYFYNKAFQFFHFHEGFVSLEDTEDMFIKSRTGIRVPIYKRLNASLQYNLDWERSPSPGREKTDKALMFTLGYMFEN
jgi:putative salt-induced outer membrane protein YdiY